MSNTPPFFAFVQIIYFLDCGWKQLTLNRVNSWSTPLKWNKIYIFFTIFTKRNKFSKNNMNENFKNYYKINFAQELMPLPCTTTTRSKVNSPESCLLCMALRRKIALSKNIGSEKPIWEQRYEVFWIKINLPLNFIVRDLGNSKDRILSTKHPLPLPTGLSRIKSLFCDYFCNLEIKMMKITQ